MLYIIYIIYSIEYIITITILETIILRTICLDIISLFDIIYIKISLRIVIIPANIIHRIYMIFARYLIRLIYIKPQLFANTRNSLEQS